MIEQTIRSGDLQLQAAIIAPEQPKAAVVFVHGMAEHKERYYPFMTYLCEQGFACVIYDQRGHGSTATGPEELGFFGKNGVNSLVEDARTVVQWAHGQYPGLKVFLFGHSMGSMVVRCFAKKYDAEIDGLVVCGSPSGNGVAGMGILLTRILQLFKGERHRSKKIAQMMFGPHTKKFKAEGTPNAWLSTNKANVEEYNLDPLCGFLFTLNADNSIDLVAIDEVVAEVDQYTFCWVANYVGTYCVKSQSGNTYSFKMLGLVDGYGYYIGFNFQFTWNK